MNFKETTQMDRSVSFLWQTPGNWYDLKIFGNSLLIQKVVNGVSYQLPRANGQFPFQANREYPIVIEVTKDQHIGVWIDQQQVLDVADQLPFIVPTERQTFALRGSVGAVTRSIVHIDDVILETEQETPTSFNLNVHLWKQTDPQWKDLEYDRAAQWSSLPTMGRWGCAVTSMAMIFRYYGITELPSGQALTPQSLNLWLKEQVDGYFNGNVNWLAMTRLSQQVSSKLGTPKLEFSRTDGNLTQITTFAKQELQANKPVILGYPGHFFVADGVDAVNNTLLTKDPYYSYQKLSQRPTLNEVNTIRRFQPSHTDLSYILLNASPGLQLSVTDSEGHVIPLEKSSEYISDPTGGSGETSPLSEQYFIQKPSTGSYQVKVFQPTEGTFSLDAFNYDVAGGVKGAHYQGSVGSEGSLITLDYHKEVTSPSASPSPAASPQSTPSPTPFYRGEGINAALRSRILEEIRQLQFILQLLHSYRFLLQVSTYQHFFQRLERLKEQTNWQNN